MEKEVLASPSQPLKVRAVDVSFSDPLLLHTVASLWETAWSRDQGC